MVHLTRSKVNRKQKQTEGCGWSGGGREDKEEKRRGKNEKRESQERERRKTLLVY